MFTLIYSNAQISGLRAKCIAPNRNKLSRRDAECRAVRGCVVRTTGTDVWTIKYPMADTAGGRSRQNDLSLSRRYALCSSLHLPEVMHSELELMPRWKAISFIFSTPEKWHIMRIVRFLCVLRFCEISIQFYVEFEWITARTFWGFYKQRTFRTWLTGSW